MKNKPGIESEYKFWIEDKENIFRLLDKKTKVKKPRQYQKSIMFDNAGGLMRETDGRIRVRSVGNSKSKILTYKKPLAPINSAKREIEYEVFFQDSTNQIEKILAVMGFKPTTSYERYQTRWEIGGVHVTFDEYPYADVVEIEGDKQTIELLAKELGFKIKDGLTKPIDTLFQEWREKRGLSFKPHMRFHDFDK